MDQQQTQDSQGSGQNDRKLVCSLLAVCGLCILGLLAVTLWGLFQWNKKVTVDAASTAAVRATQRANVTATAAVRTTEQAQYKVVDRFDTNKNDWRLGPEDSEYWYGSISIQDGVYVWDVKKPKGDSVNWATFSTNQYLRDFDVYVDTKVEGGIPGTICSGLIFRKTPDVSQKDEFYYFSLCNHSRAEIEYRSPTGDWETIASIPSHADPKEWNRMEISVRGTHFIFSINGKQIYEMDDDRRTAGEIALVAEVHGEAPIRILFDNFGFQSR